MINVSQYFWSWFGVLFLSATTDTMRVIGKILKRFLKEIQCFRKFPLKSYDLSC